MNGLERAKLLRELLSARARLGLETGLQKARIIYAIFDLRKRLGMDDPEKKKTARDRVAASPVDESSNLSAAEYAQRVSEWLPQTTVRFASMERGNAKGTALAIQSVLLKFPLLDSRSVIRVIGLGSDLLEVVKEKEQTLEALAKEKTKAQSFEEVGNGLKSKFDKAVPQMLGRNGIVIGTPTKFRNLPRQLAKALGLEKDKELKPFFSPFADTITQEFIDKLKSRFVAVGILNFAKSEVMKERPDLLENDVFKFRGMENSKTCYAVYGRGRGIVSTNFFKRNLNERYQEDCNNKWHPTGVPMSHDGAGAQSVITHELGHALDFMMGISSTQAMRDLWRKHHNKDMQEVLSLYADTKIEEMIAEGFAEYMMSPSPREVARIIGNCIESSYREYERTFGD